MKLCYSVPFQEHESREPAAEGWDRHAGYISGLGFSIFTLTTPLPWSRDTDIDLDVCAWSLSHQYT